MSLNNVKCSLTDLLGKDYIDKVIEANCFFGQDKSSLQKIADEKIEFYPEYMQEMDCALVNKIGQKVINSFDNENYGASTNSYKKAFNKNAAPLSGKGCYRIGEDGKLYFVAKSEHYHASLGHCFNGYKLIDNARKLGILNATHNNTRGYITRTLELEIIKRLNDSYLNITTILDSEKKHVLNRVINLETGSLAVEAGLKMMLKRFYGQSENEPAKYKGRVPVFLVIGDASGGCEANYHGTTIFAQTLRNIWHGYYKAAELNNIYKVVPVRINDITDFKSKIEKYNISPFKTAGFLHEIVLMNYAGITLDKEYLHGVYDLCDKYDTPTMVDEIQSCMWYKELFLFKEYDINPDFVIIGKGFSGGEYPASKVITTSDMDTLDQFGALVTNGQEELASLAYLITMKFVLENGKEIENNQIYFFDNLLKKIGKYSVVKKIEGKGYLTSIIFDNVDDAILFAKNISNKCIDVSVQTYKKHCPPAVLIKLPLIVMKEQIDYIIDVFEKVIIDSIEGK